MALIISLNAVGTTQAEPGHKSRSRSLC